MAVIDSLKEHSQYLSTALELIPAEVYFSNEGIKEKYWRKDKRKKGQGQNKIAAKQSKKAKFDPGQHKSNWDMTKEREEREMIAKSAGVDEDKMEQNSQKLKGSDVNTVKLAFQNKLQLLQKKRKRKSQDDAANMNKIKKRRDDNRKAKKAKKTPSSRSGNTKKQQFSDDKKGEANSNKLIYSKFEMNSLNPSEIKGKKKKKKDLKTILQSVQDKEAKIKEVGQTDKAKAIEMKDKMMWKSAVEKAKGTKVRDDPKLLKKSIKRQEKKKEKSKRQWNQRIQSQKNATKERQMKRKNNIKERIQRKNARKLKKSK